MQKQKQERERKNKWQNHLEPFSFHTLEELFCLGFWVFPFLALGFLISFFSSLEGAPNIDLP